MKDYAWSPLIIALEASLDFAESCLWFIKSEMQIEILVFDL